MGRSRSLEEYAMRRLRIAGGALFSGRAYEASVAAIEGVYLQPLEGLKEQLLSRSGRFVSFANYDYLGLGGDARVRGARLRRSWAWTRR